MAASAGEHRPTNFRINFDIVLSIIKNKNFENKKLQREATTVRELVNWC
jgi:hypothetical protein